MMYFFIERDIDDLVKCYKPEYMAGCSALQNFVQFVPSQHTLRKQFIEMCSEKEGIHRFIMSKRMY